MSPVAHTIPVRPIPPRQPRSSESRLRALLALALAVIAGLGVTVGVLADDGDGARAEAAPEHVSPAKPGPNTAGHDGLQLRGSRASYTGSQVR